MKKDKYWKLNERWNIMYLEVKTIMAEKQKTDFYSIEYEKLEDREKVIRQKLRNLTEQMEKLIEYE